MEDPVELQGLTGMMRKMFGDNTISCLKEKYDNGIRGFLETTSAVSQCKNVIKNFTEIDERTRKQHVCWICGFDIVPGDESFKPECEHVFPIAQTIIFTGLYRGEDIEYLRGRNPDRNINELKKIYVDRLKSEYGWAHRLCNQVKNDSHFISLNPSGDGSNTSRWIVDEEKINEFLQDIVDEKGYGNNRRRLRDLIYSTKASVDDWMVRRKNYIKSRCNEILQSIPPVNENLALLTAVGALTYDINGSGCVEEDIPPKPPSVESQPVRPITEEYLKNVFSSVFDYAFTSARRYTAGFITERISNIRNSPEERLNRASLVLLNLDLDGQANAALYNQFVSKFRTLDIGVIQPIVVANELIYVTVFKELIQKLQIIRQAYPASKVITSKITELQTKLDQTRIVRPEYGGKRRKGKGKHKTYRRKNGNRSSRRKI